MIIRPTLPETPNYTTPGGTIDGIVPSPKAESMPIESPIQKPL
jgi:hypothetical protein